MIFWGLLNSISGSESSSSSRSFPERFEVKSISDEVDTGLRVDEACDENICGMNVTSSAGNNDVKRPFFLTTPAGLANVVSSIVFCVSEKSVLFLAVIPTLVLFSGASAIEMQSRPSEPLRLTGTSFPFSCSSFAVGSGSWAMNSSSLDRNFSIVFETSLSGIFSTIWFWRSRRSRRCG